MFTTCLIFNRSLSFSSLLLKSCNIIVIGLKTYSSYNISYNASNDTTTTILKQKQIDLDVKPDVDVINKMITKHCKTNNKKGVTEYFNILESHNLTPNQYSFEQIILMYINLNEMVLYLVTYCLNNKLSIYHYCYYYYCYYHFD